MHHKFNKADQCRGVEFTSRVDHVANVGSLAIPFAKLHSKVNVITSASHPDSAQWCKDRGADLVINYQDIATELEKQGLK